MNDFSGILPSDFGSNRQMKPRSTSNRSSAAATWSSTPIGANLDPASLFSTHNPKSRDPSSAFDDILGGGHAKRPASKSSDDVFNFDWAGGGGDKSAAGPVFDKPLYDEDVFDGVPGLKDSDSSKYEDVFSSISSPPNESSGFDDLLGNFGKTAPESKKSSGRSENGAVDFDYLIPGFSGSNPGSRSTVETNRHPNPSRTAKSTSNTMDDPFVVLESTSPPKGSSSGKFTDHLEQSSKIHNSDNIKVENLPGSTVAFDDIDPLDNLGRSMPAYSSDMNSRGNDKSSLRTGSSASGTQNSSGRESAQRASVRGPDNQFQTKPDNHMEFRQAFFDMPSVSSDLHKSLDPNPPPLYENLEFSDIKVQSDMSSQFEETAESSDDIWLTVSEIPLFTQPTTAPPPSRPPPPRPVQISKGERGSLDPKNVRKKVHESSSFSSFNQNFESSKSDPSTARSSVAVSQIDELEDFAMGKSRNNIDEDRNAASGEEVEANSAAAAMKEAMDRAEAKFRHAKEVRERENVKAARSKEAGHFERDEKSVQEAQERALREKQERLELERQRQEREEEREQKRLEKEKERAREIEREREKARQAVERATREARERAAAEARTKAERAAVEKANAEARERAERAAVQRAQAEARERAAAEAKERAERAASEARERERAAARAEAEARLRAERAAAERAAVERAAAEARERAASAARANQQKNDNDLESFFSMGSRPSSAPRPRSNSSESTFDTQFQSRQGSDAARRTSAGVSSSMRKASSTTNIVDDLSSIFGAAPSSGEFQEVDGETDERRRARLERHQRTQERAAKALAEKNERDLQSQREQAERHRIAETLDVEIKRWAAGKEGNLRALLSTLQYVLWPECGWQPVSLTDLITAASVKKVYRKATLCIHPDKVQQKGATLQQKYIAEKVFDLLKEAWNKFNSEELF